MCPIPPCPSSEAWLTWLETTQIAACRTYLCTAYGLDLADADALINTARWQVYRYWVTIENPLAYFWQTLRRAVHAQRRRRAREQHQQQGYAAWWQGHVQQTARALQQATDVLEATPPRQRLLLRWFVLGYDDTQVAAWLKTTPTAVRVRRHAAYRALRARVDLPPSRQQVDSAAPPGPSERLLSHDPATAEADDTFLESSGLTQACPS